MLPCNFNHLYYFYRVAVHRSVSKASKELLIAQSALSTQLKQLEESLEMILFNRTKRGMTLTEKGELVFRHASRMYETYEEMKRAVVLAETEVRGPLNLACVHSIGIYLLPRILTEFRKKYGDVHINLELSSSSKVMEKLQENQVDLALIAWNRLSPLLDSRVIMQNHMILVAHPDHPITKKRNPKIQDLAEVEFIAYEAGTPTRVMIDAHFKGAGLQLNYVMESTSIGTIKHLAIAGMGLALLPEIGIQLELKSRRLKRVNIPDTQIDRPITLYWKDKRVLPRPAQKFVEFLGEWKETGEETD